MPRVNADDLESFVRELVAGLGADERVAQEVSESLVESDLRGHGSHGSIRMGTLYYDLVQRREIDPRAEPDIERFSGGTARVDGRFQYGQVVGRRAVETGVDLAKEHGVAAVGVRNATHLGRIGEWAERTADAGVCFAAFVNGGGTTPTVAPPGSVDRLLSTNPLAFGFPSFGVLSHPIVLDMATSQVANGKVTKRSVEGRPIPEGWVVNADGEPVTDTHEYDAERGTLMPLGGLTAGHKGFGLSVVAELFAGMVGDHRVSGQHDDRGINNGAAFFFVDPGRFSDPEANRARVAALRDTVCDADSPEGVPMGPAAKGGRALLPGEPEHRKREARLEDGVPFRRETLDLLASVARQLDRGDAVPGSFER